MIELIEIFIIAIAQGIGEFLPISSSGHNAVINHLFERFSEPLTEDSAEFVKLNILLHVGSLIAVLIVFRQRIINMFGKDLRLIPILIVATIPAVIVGFPMHKFAPWIQDSLLLISGCFIVTGILLLTTLRLPEGKKTISTMTWTDALIIGCSQAIAILPGISRSGTTIVTGLFCQLKREEAAAFSFLLSIPVIVGGGLLECLDMLKRSSAEPTVQMIPDGLLVIGASVSCTAGILALIFLLDWLKKGKLWYFAIWVFVMSPITLTLAILPMPEKAEQPSSVMNRLIINHSNTFGTESPPNTAAVKGQDSTSISLLGQSEGENIFSPLDLPPVMNEDDDALRERILAEERAKELALSEEERTIIPLVGEPDKLIPLDPQDRIWVTPDIKSVILIGRVALREGFLELLACRIRTKEHESILSVHVKPYLVHAALLVVNARQGKPAQFSPTFVPATGDKIDITLRWTDESGKQHEAAAQDWVWDMLVSTEESKKPMTTYWVFSGSKEYQDVEGNNRYLANETGELFGLSNFVGSILDVPIRSSADNTQLLFGCFTERIPPLDTPVTIILTPVR